MTTTTVLKKDSQTASTVGSSFSSRNEYWANNDGEHAVDDNNNDDDNDNDDNDGVDCYNDDDDGDNDDDDDDEDGPLCCGNLVLFFGNKNRRRNKRRRPRIESPRELFVLQSMTSESLSLLDMIKSILPVQRKNSVRRSCQHQSQHIDASYRDDDTLAYDIAAIRAAAATAYGAHASIQKAQQSQTIDENYNYQRDYGYDDDSDSDDNNHGHDVRSCQETHCCVWREEPPTCSTDDCSSVPDYSGNEPMVVRQCAYERNPPGLALSTERPSCLSIAMEKHDSQLHSLLSRTIRTLPTTASVQPLTWSSYSSSTSV